MLSFKHDFIHSFSCTTISAKEIPLIFIEFHFIARCEVIYTDFLSAFALIPDLSICSFNVIGA